MLTLADLEDYTEKQIKDHLMKEYNADKKDLQQFKIIIAYESVGDWGCDSSSWFLLQKNTTNHYYEIHGSHDSTCGFNDQYVPRKTTKKYLKSKYFSFLTGGYDKNDEEHMKRIKEFLSML